MLAKTFKPTYVALIVGIFFLGVILRLLIFDKAGGDYLTYHEAVREFAAGKNPYRETVISFRLLNLEHGYAYFPTLLYIQYIIWLISNVLDFNISTIYLWKVPVLIADALIFYVIVKRLGTPKSWLNLVLNSIVASFWLLNPYLIARYDYSLYDPIFILFLLLALENLEKRPFLSGVLFSTAVSLKTIPLILFPLFFIKTNKKIQFVGACIFMVLIISLPFMKSFYDFYLYLQGSFFVHAARELQGRPVLSYISYFTQDYGFTFAQNRFIKIYSVLALTSAFIVPIILFYKKIIFDKYVWATISFSFYLLLTPVLSRTHILWVIPWLLLAIVEFVKNKSTNRLLIRSIAVLCIIWITMFLYLYKWDKGIEVENMNSKEFLVLKDSTAEWEFSRILRHRFYEFRGKIFSE